MTQAAPAPSCPRLTPPPPTPHPAVFTRSVVLNITRKNREWRFYEFIGLRLEDLPKASAVISDIRKILRQVGAAPPSLAHSAGPAHQHAHRSALLDERAVPGSSDAARTAAL